MSIPLLAPFPWLPPTDPVKADFTSSAGEVIRVAIADDDQVIYTELVELADTLSGDWNEPIAEIMQHLSIVQVSADGIVLDRPSMTVGFPYAFWVEDVFLVAVKQNDESVDFYSVPQ